MSNKHHRYSGLGVLMLGSFLGTTGYSLPALAQEAATEDVAIEEVAIVGTRIKRKDEVANSPIFTLSEDDLIATGLVSTGEMLQELPGVGFSLNSNGSGGVSHGTSSLNLRNLGANRALILVNGHRWVAGSGTRGFRDFVDLNTIPQSIIGRVEVLKDGATAIYGADAIAGVVNIHTRKMDGIEVNGYGGITSRGDGETMSFDATWGKTFDKGSVMVSAMFTDQKEIYTEDRELTAVPLNGLSTTSPYGRYSGSPLGGRITRIAGTDGSSPDDFRAFVDPDDRTNIYDHTYVTGPLRRYALFGQAEYQLSDAVHFTAEVMYNNRRSDQLFSPVTPRVRGSEGYVLLADHPYNPFGEDFSSSLQFDRQLDELGQRVNLQKVETWRFAAGLDGEFSNGWSWDVFYSHGRNDSSFDSLNQVDQDHLALGLGPNDRCVANNCVPIDYLGVLTDEMVDYLRYDAHDEHGTRQHDFTANISGDLFEAPAGTIGFAAGFEYRRESAFDNPDSYVNADPEFNSYRTTTSAPRDASSGHYDLYEFYTEVNVPLLKDLPMIHDLNMDAAVRYSHYSTFGDTTNLKLGLGWRPVEDLLVRATYAEGFRAPSILEFTPAERATNLVANDPCSGGGAGLPGCAGVPATYEQNGNQVLATVSGNPDLQPETSRNYSLGAVFTPAALSGFSLSVDWYRIKVSDTITSLGSQRILDLCANTGEKCELISRASNGEILNLLDGPVNLNATTVEGWDFTARYQVTGTSYGDFTFLADASYLTDYVDELVNDDGSITVQHREGTSDVLRESIPKWRSRGSVRWDSGQWSATYAARMIGSTDEAPDDPLTGDIPAVWYHDVSATYRFQDSDVALTLGAENIFDKQPPVSLVNTNVNFDINTYNAKGAFFYVRLSARFGG
ncbi:MAG: TonB-dependent receptor [Alphaproteobacteria bacterium]|nr:MAG: TonB-dependent receptor [Alphaproteobacteria bacterium]